MKLSKQLLKEAQNGYIGSQEEMDKFLLKLDLKRIRKSISIREATKNRI